MKLLVKSILIIALLTPVLLKAQPDLPPEGEAFNDSIVPRIDIFIDPDTLLWIYENVESNVEFHSTFIFDNGNIIDTIEESGFRLRGNTSRYSEKKSFKVSFNTYDPGRKWQDLEKLNLNGEHNDPSVIRSKLCWDLLNDFGIAGARANHVQLFINENNHGLYINIEHIDEEFVKSRFGNNDGNLYKCLYPADLNYLGSDPDNYKLMQDDRRVYALKTNTGEDDYSDLANFIDVLNNTPDEDFLCELEKVFNVYDYLKIMAFDVFTANWDGYIFNKNNFYLYHNTKTGKFEYINYDLDNTFGIDWFNIEWEDRDIYEWDQGNRPLYSRLMQVPELRDQYTHYIDYFATQIIGTEEYSNEVNSLKWKHAPYITADPFYPLDYGFTYNDYIDSFDEPLGMHVKSGLLTYIDDRKASVYDQLESTTPSPLINHIRNNYPQEGEELKIKAFVDCIDDDDEVALLFTVNDGEPQEAPMFDDGDHADKEPGDGIYGCILPDIQLNSTIVYQVSATGYDELTTIKPCEPITFQLLESTNPQLFINEFMADNETTIADEQGEFDDWLEVYNGDDEAVWLGDKYLSDNLNNEDKWLMPDITLQPGQFVLFWADNDTEQGDYHTNFKLNAEGEEIGIFDSENTGFFVLDSITYGMQDTDISAGRQPDGNDNWVFFTASTPGSSNNPVGINHTGTNLQEFSVYPNPVTEGEIWFDRSVSFKIYSTIGKPVYKADNVKNVQLGILDPGIYLLITSEGQAVKLIIP